MRTKTPARLLESLLFLAAVSVDLLMWGGDSRMNIDGNPERWWIPAGSIMALAALAPRRRFPVPVLIIQLGWASVCGIVFTEYTPLIGIVVALNALAQRRAPVCSLMGWGACSLPFASFAWNRGSAQVQFTILLVLMLIAGSAWLLGYRAQRADRRAAERAATAAADATEALRSERLRIARELHDIVSHAVSVMVIQSAGARAVLRTDPDRAESALDVVQDVGRQSMNELRRLLGLLRSAAGDTGPDDRPPHDLAGIDALLASAGSTGLTVSKQVWGTPAVLDPSVGLAAYRLVQEAVTNTLKHVGPGAAVRVGLNWAPEQLTVTVQNDEPDGIRRAPGTAPPSTGHGLLGLRERVQTVGGSLHTGPTSTGYMVQAVLPTVVQPLPSTGAERIFT